MQWPRSEHLPTPHPNPKSIPDPESVRLAALQASWNRDRRVAQRRIAWRWITWYTQRYAPHALAGMVVLAGVAYCSGIRPQWSLAGNDLQSASQEEPLRYMPPSVPTAPVAVPAPVDVFDTVATDPGTDAPLVLRNSMSFEPRSAGPEPVAEVSADTLSLKPENWLHSKEP